MGFQLIHDFFPRSGGQQLRLIGKMTGATVFFGIAMATTVSTTAQKNLFLAFMDCSTSPDGPNVHPSLDFIAFPFPVMLLLPFRSSAFTFEVVMDPEKVTKSFL
jgi:hypothetical protein